MPDLAMAPRRITATSTLHLFPEPRTAWFVPPVEPFEVNPSPRWRIAGMTFGSLAVEYEASPDAGASEVSTLYAAAEDAAAQLAAFPTIRWVPMGHAASDELLHPDAVAFSLEDARERAQALKVKAEAAKAKVRGPGATE